MGIQIATEQDAKDIAAEERRKTYKAPVLGKVGCQKVF